MAKALGVQRESVRKWCLKEDFPGGDTGPWVLSDVFKWCVHNEIFESNKKRAAIVPGDDPEMLGPDSPGLERFRNAKADMAEMDVAVRLGTLLRREDVRAGLVRIAGILREAGETLQTGFGAEAHAVLDDALHDCERETRDLFGEETDDGTAD